MILKDSKDLFPLGIALIRVERILIRTPKTTFKPARAEQSKIVLTLQRFKLHFYK